MTFISIQEDACVCGKIDLYKQNVFVKFHLFNDEYPTIVFYFFFIVMQPKEVLVLIIINKQVAWFMFVVLLCGLASLYN